MAENAYVVLPMDIQVVLQNDLVEGQSARLVSAQNIHRPQILYGIEVLDDGFFVGHAYRALGKACCHNHGQHFGGKPNRDGKGKQGSVYPVTLGETIDKQNQGHHDQHKANKYPGNLVNAFFKAGLCWLGCNALGHFAKYG